MAVFAVDKKLIREINTAAKNGENMDRFKGRSTLKLVQSIIPDIFRNCTRYEVTDRIFFAHPLTDQRTRNFQ